MKQYYKYKISVFTYLESILFKYISNMARSSGLLEPLGTLFEVNGELVSRF